MAKTALIVIDLQNDYFPGGKWELQGIDQAAAHAAKLIAASRASDDLIVHVRHEFPTEAAPFFVPGSSGAEIHPMVSPNPGETVVLKNHVNAFLETDLKSILDENGIGDLTICGAMSHMCVDAATRAASDLGYNVSLIHDACATRDTEFQGTTVPAESVHATLMSALGFAYATLFSTKDYLASRQKAEV